MIGQLQSHTTTHPQNNQIHLEQVSERCVDEKFIDESDRRIMPYVNPQQNRNSRLQNSISPRVVVSVSRTSGSTENSNNKQPSEPHSARSIFSVVAAPSNMRDNGHSSDAQSDSFDDEEDFSDENENLQNISTRMLTQSPNRDNKQTQAFDRASICRMPINSHSPLNRRQNEISNNSESSTRRKARAPVISECLIPANKCQSIASHNSAFVPIAADKDSLASERVHFPSDDNCFHEPLAHTLNNHSQTKEANKQNNQYMQHTDQRKIENPNVTDLRCDLFINVNSQSSSSQSNSIDKLQRVTDPTSIQQRIEEPKSIQTENEKKVPDKQESKKTQAISLNLPNPVKKIKQNIRRRMDKKSGRESCPNQEVYNEFAPLTLGSAVRPLSATNDYTQNSSEASTSFCLTNPVPIIKEALIVAINKEAFSHPAKAERIMNNRSCAKNTILRNLRDRIISKNTESSDEELDTIKLPKMPHNKAAYGKRYDLQSSNHPIPLKSEKESSSIQNKKDYINAWTRVFANSSFK